MADRIQVPRTAALLGPAIDAIVCKYPPALKFINLGAGRWADLIAGLEGQCALITRQIADEVAAARLLSAQGDALTQLAQSEWQTQRQSGATYAIGAMYLARTGTAAGVIPQGFRFPRPAAPSYNPPSPAATYVATRDVAWPQGSLSLAVPIAASVAGAASSAPYFDAASDNTEGGLSLPTLGDTPFDTTITITGFEAAGGSDGESDPDLRAEAQARGTGAYGPTLGAILAGALSGIGVHKVACFDLAQGYPAGNSSAPMVPCAFTGVAIADSSFASGYGAWPSTRLGVWENTVAQIIADAWQGVGGMVTVTGVANIRVAVAAAVNLRSGDDLNSTTDIDVALQAAATSYFNDRPDWWTWTARGLRAALSRAHPKILSCSGVTVTDIATGSTLAEPPSKPIPYVNGLAATHWMLVQNGVTPTYAAPT